MPEIFAGIAVFGTATAFESPAAAALLPGVTPEGMLQKATALSSAAFQVAVISGPALGGLAYAVAPGCALRGDGGVLGACGLLNGAIRLDRPVTAKEPPTLAAMFAGVGFVRHNPAILGTISLDLFAVLLGGATALMPIYARDILHTGPWGLGVLRAAPAVGALLMTAVLARHAINRRVGNANVPGGDRLWPGDGGVCALPSDLALASGARHHGCGGYGERGDPRLPGATWHTPTRCAAGWAR